MKGSLLKKKRRVCQTEACAEEESLISNSSQEKMQTHIKHGGMKAAPWELARDAYFGPQGGKKTLAGLGGEALG